MDDENDLIEQDDAISQYLQSLLTNPADETVFKNDLIDNTSEEAPVKAVEIPVKSGDDDSSEFQSHLPAWAKNPFPCQSVFVNGFELLIPASYIRGIRDIPATLIHHSDEMPDWIFGVYFSRDKNICVVNSEAILFGRQGDHTKDSTGHSTHQFVLLLGDGSWGVSCDSVGVMETRNPEIVDWCTRENRYFWQVMNPDNAKQFVVDIRRLEMSILMERSLV